MAEAQFPRPFGSYTLRAELGRGGMGTVYRAWDSASRREVALKVCTPGGASLEEAARFLREARLLESLEHPNLVQLLDSGEVDGVAYLAMELIEGENLGQRLDRVTRLAPEEAVRLTAQVARAVAELHRNGVVHRDLKPANVLLGRDGTPLLADLGLARGPALESLTQSGVILGTPAYLAPEQIKAKEIGPAADVYALGVLLFRAISGRLPFDLSTTIALLEAHLRRPPPRLRSLAPGVSAKLEAVVGRCLEKRPGDRFAHAGLLADALEELDVGALGPVQSPGLAPWREGRLLLVGVILAASSVGLTAWIALRARQSPSPLVTTTSAADPRLSALLAEGEAALDQHRLLEAGEAFGAASELDPDCAAAWGGLARVASRCGMRETARRHNARALELDPGLLPALLGQGTLLLAEKELAAAEEFLAQAEAAKVEGERFADDVELFRALVVFDQGRPDEALARTQRVVERGPASGRAWMALADLYNRVHRSEDAALTMEQGMRRAPTPRLFAFRQLLGQILERSERERRGWLEEALEVFPKHPEVLSAVAMDLLQLGEPARARALLEFGLELYPDAPQLLCTRAEQLLEEGQVERAAKTLDHALREAPKHPLLLRLSCEAKLALGRERAALDAARTLAHVQPDELSYQELVYTVGTKAGDWGLARAAAERCWDVDPGLASVVRLINLSLVAEDHADARVLLARGLELAPQNEHVRFSLLGVRLLQGEAEVMPQIVAGAEEGSARSIDAAVMLARYQLETRGDPSAASPWIRRALELRPNEPLVLVLKGDLDLARGDLRVAIEAYEAALVVDPLYGEALAGIAEALVRLDGKPAARYAAQLAVDTLTRSRRAPRRLERMQALLAQVGGEGLLDLELDADEQVREGELSMQAGDWLRAEACFRAALLCARGCGRAWLGLGRVNADRTRNETARTQLQRALHWIPGSAEALALAAVFARLEGDRGQAASLAETLERQAPESPWLRYVRGEEARAAGNTALGEREHEAALVADPGEVMFAQAMVLLLMRELRFKEALELLDGPLTQAMRPRLQTERAVVWLASGDPERAREAFKGALRTRPESAWSLRLYGEFEANQGRTEDALSALRRAVQLDPLRSNAWPFLVQLELSTGDLQAADRSLGLQLAAAYPRDRPFILHGLAKLAYETKRWPERARAWAEQLCVLEPDSVPALALLARIQLRAGERRAAAEVHGRILKLEPTDRDALANLASSALEGGDFEHAAELVDRLLRAHPDEWLGYALRGRLRAELADPEGAWGAFMRCVELNPTLPAARRALLGLGEELGRWAEVRTHARALLRLPSLPEEVRQTAREALERAERELAR